MASCLRHPRLQEITSQSILALNPDRTWAYSKNAAYTFSLFVNDDCAESFPVENEKDTLNYRILKRFEGSLKTLQPFRASFDHEAGRCLSESWNKGITENFALGAELCLVIGNDCILEYGSLERMIETLGKHSELDIVSGCRSDVTVHNERVGFGRCDFSCFMLRRSTIDRFGLFDVNYKPAYFEDNDYCARVILGGGQVGVDHTARYHTEGSATTKHDPEAARLVNQRFAANREYFVRKWSREPANDPEEIRSTYFQHPFNDSGKPLSWFQQ